MAYMMLWYCHSSFIIRPITSCPDSTMATFLSVHWSTHILGFFLNTLCSFMIYFVQLLIMFPPFLIRIALKHSFSSRHPLIYSSVILVVLLRYTWYCGGGAVFSLSPLLEWAFSHSWLLLNLTGANWEWPEIQKRHRIDRQTESGVRCVGRSGGDTQPSLLLFSIFIL
jgi:hypothetical protein